MSDEREVKGEIGLFVTCLIDVVRPGIGFDAVALLEDAGYRVRVPRAQTCCGQPNYNGGDRKGALEVARRTVDTFLPFDYTVLASGSCAGMIKCHYPKLLEDDEVYFPRAMELAGKVHELSAFLIEVADYRPRPIKGNVTYHDACAGLREMGVKSQPRELLSRAGVEIVEMQEPEVCCGFGGTFCVKYPNVSNNMVAKKVKDAQATEADRLVAGDLGCLLNMEGKLHRDGGTMQVLHFAELLAAGLEE